uniref:Spermatogenesis-associated protein 7 n=1 Tax=Clastoptera arizonana TaxID=38151 RepID=A0A1B6DTL4_9HEMI
MIKSFENSVYPKTLVGQNMIFQNMSNHYRRIYNAKPRVDSKITSSSTVAKSHHDTRPRTDKKFIRNSNTNRSTLLEDGNKCTTYRQCFTKSNMDYMEKENPSYQPRILKSNIDSKVRKLEVYHPPRRRGTVRPVKLKFQPHLELDTNTEENNWHQTINPVEKLNMHPSTCSSDSAYTEEGEVGWSGGESRGITPINTLPLTPMLEWNSGRPICRNRDDSLYVKFLREITDDILRKGVFTNKALKQIFQDHIKLNKFNLSNVRMQEEIEKLCLELSVPKEDYLNDVEFGVGVETIAQSEAISSYNYTIQDKELLDALNQLDISEQLKNDIVNSLGLRTTSENAKVVGQYSSSSAEIQNFKNNKDLLNRRNSQIPSPLCDEDSNNEYEVLSNCSEMSQNLSNDGSI